MRAAAWLATALALCPGRKRSLPMPNPSTPARTHSARLRAPIHSTAYTRSVAARRAAAAVARAVSRRGKQLQGSRAGFDRTECFGGRREARQRREQKPARQMTCACPYSERRSMNHRQRGPRPLERPPAPCLRRTDTDCRAPRSMRRMLSGACGELSGTSIVRIPFSMSARPMSHDLVRRNAPQGRNDVLNGSADILR